MDVTEWFGETSGGIRTYMLEKARFVSAHPEWAQCMVVPGAADSIQDMEGSRIYRIKGPRIPGQDPYRLLLARRKLRRIVAHEQPQIIEAGSPFLSAWLARGVARDAGVPIVTYYHSNVPGLFRNSVAQRLSRSYLRRLHAPYAATIASSRYSMRELETAGISNVEYVPLGVDTELFNPARRGKRSDTRARYGLPEGQLAGFIGRFAKEKELEVLLRAWPEVERHAGAALVLVGAGPLLSQLRLMARGVNVHFLPFLHDRHDVADLLAALDLYVSPGRVETFGLSSLEALSSGTMVLGADEGGVAEQIEQSGAGSTFRSGDAASLAAAAIGLLSEVNRAMQRREHGRAYAVEHHSWQVVMQRLFALYVRVIGE